MKVLHDIFPAIISMTKHTPTDEAPLSSRSPSPLLRAHTVDRARVIVTTDRIIVAVDSPEGPTVIFNQAYDPQSARREPTDNKTTELFLTTTPSATNPDDQPIYVAYSRYQDCACGSRLRGWNPFGRLSSTLSIKDN